MSSNRFTSFREFFPYYLAEHSVPTCRALHYTGTILGTGVALYALLTMQWWMLLLYPLIGYGFAWVGHFFIEHNKPATFTYPRWSWMGDYKMLWLWMTGRLKPALEDAEKLYGQGTGAVNRA
ncbi:DUF962 domain-containing protein [Pseudokordiimonas caeni]|uniref:DUF962 domain-containing protein n=1 Tax=Pseudokordiimonas caeni TaxID=2997908 RepID=UPI0028118112|nr:DUF962 domain-containing protein [Pseudokordiimonas caeni]